MLLPISVTQGDESIIENYILPEFIIVTREAPVDKPGEGGLHGYPHRPLDSKTSHVVIVNA